MTVTAVDIEQDVIGYARENYSDPDLTLEKVAERMGYSERTIQRSLESCQNRWLSILTGVRMEKARKLLVSSDTAIDNIAYEVGYSNMATFRRNYRRKYGESPSKTRKEARSRGNR